MKVNTGPVTELEFSAGLKNNLKHSTVLLTHSHGYKERNQEKREQ
jgi:hypothetical protein